MTNPAISIQARSIVSCFGRVIVVVTLAVFAGVADAGLDQRAGPDAGPHVQANAAELRRTIVTPHLEQAIDEKSNVLWCGTFQLAWNELCNLVGGTVEVRPKNCTLEVLNKQTVSSRDFDPASYVAKAGLVRDGVYREIQADMQRRFAGQASPDLLPIIRDLPQDGWATYAFLFKQMPFRWSFDRFDRNLRFQGKKVDSFGIRHFGDGGKRDARMARQVDVYDYRNSDDFIVELRTESSSDRLLLAKVTAEATLDRTIASVQERIADTKPELMRPGAYLTVPVVDFEILRRYPELEGIRIAASSKSLDGQRLEFAAQTIRFRLDETGAVLKSEALGGGFGGLPSKNLIFDKPFLILLQQRRAEQPYFALWVNNAELLIGGPRVRNR
ncbi:MAG: hypothetical protein AAF266_12435 [Planctomycetota bacterium]